MKRRLAILGSTGSIGTQALEVVREHPDRFEVVALSAHSRAAPLAEQAREFRVRRLALTGDSPETTGLGPEFQLHTGPDSLAELVREAEPDVVLNAVTGAAGLRASLQGVDQGADLALANKESLVVAGRLILERAEGRGARVIPVDSEHSALLQCLRGGRESEVRRLHLTASGGPFRGRTRESLTAVSPDDALRHPTWSMGPKITIDSATLMNKALELIEAHVLFDFPAEEIEVVVHPESIVHSMVEFHDGSIIAHLGHPDMRIPIQYALSQPERWRRADSPLDWAALRALHFEALDDDTFPSIRLARRVCAGGGTLPAVFNAANEIAVAEFLAGRIPFLSIFELVTTAVDRHHIEPLRDLEQVLEVDRETRRQVLEWSELHHD